MNNPSPITLASAVGSLSPVSLASVLDQSVDCVKVIGLDGTIQFMNGNGLCAMEIDDLCAVLGQQWSALWPEEAQQAIEASYGPAASGETARFRAFCPTAKGDPRWWDVTVSMVADEDGQHAGYLSLSRDVTEQHFSREALETAAAEMKHRLKNTYMMVSSLMMGFARGDKAREAFAEEMGNRLGALSTAQSLFTSNEASCHIDNLIPALLKPFDNPTCPVVIDDQAAVTVDQGQADAIALVVGELSVNSAKHGALSHGGEIYVASSVGEGSLVIDWTERSTVPPAEHHREGGQGLQLIDRIVRARRGTIDIIWKPWGLTVRLAFRLS
ncbi:PAS domain S-box protein [Sphingomonas koreensis]|nr:PAS domain S-box protein [Sphingomonas koreensis]